MNSSLLNKITAFYSNSQHLIKGSALSFLMNMAGVGLNFLFALVAGNYCGSTLWGTFTISITVLQIAGVISRVGLDTVTMRISAEEHETNIPRVKDTYLKSTAVIIYSSLLISVLLFFLSDFIAIRIFKTEMADELRLMSIAVLPMNLLFLNSESLKGIKLPAASSFFRNVVIFLFGLPLLLLAIKTWKTDSLSESYVLGIILSCLLGYFFWIRNTSFFNIKRSDWITYKELIKQGIPLMLSGSLIYLMIWTDTLLLGVFRTEDEVGIYNVAFRVSMLLTITLTAVYSVSSAELAICNRKKDMIGLQNAIDKGNRLIFWTTLPVAIFTILFAGPLLKIFGGDFEGGRTSLILLVLGRLFFSMCGIRGIILPMIGKQKEEQYISLAIIVISVVLNLIFIPVWGINGAAFSTMVTTIIWTIITVVYLRKSMKLNALYIPFAGKLLALTKRKINP